MPYHVMGNDYLNPNRRVVIHTHMLGRHGYLCDSLWLQCLTEIVLAVL